jgi:hypothetical protein
MAQCESSMVNRPNNHFSRYSKVYSGQWKRVSCVSMPRSHMWAYFGFCICILWALFANRFGCIFSKVLRARARKGSYVQTKGHQVWRGLDVQYTRVQRTLARSIAPSYNTRTPRMGNLFRSECQEVFERSTSEYLYRMDERTA